VVTRLISIAAEPPKNSSWGQDRLMNANPESFRSPWVTRS